MWMIVGILAFALAAPGTAAEADHSFSDATGTVRVLRPHVSVPIPSPERTYFTGNHLPVFQQNDEYFVAVLESNNGNTLCAFPLAGREGRSAWVSPQNEMFFADKTMSCAGKLYLRDGEELPVSGETSANYKAMIERFGHSAEILIPKLARDIEFIPAPPPKPVEAKPKPAVIRLPPVQTAPTPPAPHAPGAKPQTTAAQPTPSKPMEPLPLVERNQDLAARMNDTLARFFSLGQQQRAAGVYPSISGGAPESRFAERGIQRSWRDLTARDVFPFVLYIFDKYQPYSEMLLGITIVLAILFAWSRRVTERRMTGFRTLFKLQPAGVGDSSAAFSGSLSSMSLGSVTQFLNSDKETGVLTIRNNENSDVGTIIIVKGDILDARASDKRGVDAVYTILGTKDGFFSFARGEQPNVERTVKQSTISLLLDAHRLMDENRSSDQMPA